MLGTSFAFVHLLDAVGDDMPFPLPDGSRLMQTGGFKGKSREVPAEKLRRDLASLFAVDERAIVYAEPPWARVVPVDPVTLEPVADGEVGLAKIIDLANVDSAVAVLTQDRVRRVSGGFELLGRAPGAAPRGCSIAIDEMLGRTGDVEA